jgi:hypothetical protein
MKINSFPSTDEFCVRDCIIADTPCKLVFPHQIGVKWTNANKCFRSSIWTNDGDLVSASFRKFTNLLEQPDFEPLDEKGKLEWIKKIDGSTLVISKFRGQLIVRTRGTVDAESTMENGDEIPALKQKYPALFDNELVNTESVSILCEWFSPRNIIVEIESSEPELWLIGIVNHNNYEYFPQEKLDDLAKLWNIPRPERFQFNTVCEMADSVKEWKKGEGIVVYGNNGQVLKKAKADLYLVKHRMKDELNSENRFIELYVHEGMPNYQEFFDIVQNIVDFETATAFRGRISKVVDAGKEVKRIIEGMKNFVKDMRNLPRKEAAMAIINSYGGEKNSRASFAFCILDGKTLTNDQIVKLFWQTMKIS